MKRIFDSRLMLIISMAIFGTIGLFRRSIDISSGELAFYRAVLAAVFIGLFLLVTKNRIPFGKIKKQLPVLIISGIAMAFNWILLFEAYNYTTVSAATLSYYFAPVIVTVLCPILFKEKMGMKQWLCFIMSTVGIVLITGIGSFDTGSNHFLGILFGLGAACLYATVIILNKFTKGVDGIYRTFIQFVSAVIALCPYVLFTSGINITSLDKKGIALLLVVGLVHTGITYCMYFSSLKDLTGQKAAILSYIDPLVAVLCSALILHETMTVTQMIGGVLILGFTLWNELSPKKEEI
ncbi:MAG: EamA family transporter [Clostridia bacterium]|nr:EamA family transporter [Clostridia bacterium]